MIKAIPTFSDYIRWYMAAPKVPGEHHFVACYLLPRVFKITGEVPGHVNPDGMKMVAGDITSPTDSTTPYAIEVKLGTVRLTTREFNSCLLYTSPSPRDQRGSRMPSSA